MAQSVSPERGAARPGTGRTRRVLAAAAPWAWPLLAVSVLVRVAATLSGGSLGRLLDLHVYVDGAATTFSGNLYGFVLQDGAQGAALPFTYPPFAAVLFYPLHLIPFTVLGVAWQVLSVAALYAVVRIALRMAMGDGADAPHIRTSAVLWTVIGMWLEPMRVTINFGQINIFLVLLVMVAVQSRRSWCAGLLVGIAAGIKLTPAVTGLYFLARRRWAAAWWSAVAFAGTVAVSFALIGDETRRYFEDLLGDADRIGPVGAPINQSLRGALSRIAGHDLGDHWIVVGTIIAFAALSFVAWRALDRDDRLGTLTLVQLLGLLASPISWNHHWVWVLPMIIWLLHGAVSRYPGARTLAVVWTVVMLVGVSSVLLNPRTAAGEVIGGSPAEVVLGTVDVALTIVTVGWAAWAGRCGRVSPARAG
ncbi:mannosyltransferase [Tomitella fengzijianii]|uniref:mannosyltransferase n=1 Tax=Tomitella fengzijianii TaxID=2597660 RepID=UPI001E4A329A|nr:mannosyltransferase [Tomitella fengzijianii]